MLGLWLQRMSLAPTNSRDCRGVSAAAAAEADARSLQRTGSDVGCEQLTVQSGLVRCSSLLGRRPFCSARLSCAGACRHHGSIAQSNLVGSAAFVALTHMSFMVQVSSRYFTRLWSPGGDIMPLPGARLQASALGCVVGTSGCWCLLVCAFCHTVRRLGFTLRGSGLPLLAYRSGWECLGLLA